MVQAERVSERLDTKNAMDLTTGRVVVRTRTPIKPFKPNDIFLAARLHEISSAGNELPQVIYHYLQAESVRCW